MNAKVLASVVLKVWGITRVVGALASLPVDVLLARRARRPMLRPV